MTKKEEEALRELQNVCRTADKLIQNILERQTINEGGEQTEQLIKNFQESEQLANKILKKLNLDYIVAEVLLELGVPAHVKGYNCLVSAIKLVIENPEILESITECLYPCIAKENKISPVSVERAIRNVIGRSYFQNSENSEIINKIFGNSIPKGKRFPTNSQYIASVANYISLNYEFTKSN